MKMPGPPNPILYRPKEEMGLIQGRVPMSINEWYVAQALDKEQFHYFYQFAIDGGSELRGGQTIDFLVMNAGWIPVYVNGDYWHNTQNDPELPIKIAAARDRFNREPVIIKEKESNTRAAALAAVRRYIK